MGFWEWDTMVNGHFFNLELYCLHKTTENGILGNPHLKRSPLQLCPEIIPWTKTHNLTFDLGSFGSIITQGNLVFWSALTKIQGIQSTEPIQVSYFKTNLSRGIFWVFFPPFFYSSDRASDGRPGRPTYSGAPRLRAQGFRLMCQKLLEIDF